MARALGIEEEAGICSGFVRPHNGYYGGDFGPWSRSDGIARAPDMAIPSRRRRAHAQKAGSVVTPRQGGPL
jgi:hypothetical protein